ncbi:MAG: T9SS type A sorting domain-containing protein, partial [candidate division WOR-3 bacterium]|nr:T9SS type A sorting domain-containing protein [candidate division WOR-3 bacterium]
VNEDSSGGHRVESYWLDNDRFVMFWKDPSAYPIIVGRVFSDRGLTRHPIRGLIWWDSLWLAHGGSEGWYSTAVSPNDSFAYTHMRTYFSNPDTSDPSKDRSWEHGAGILGYIQDNEPIRWTNLFEYTPPLGADTVGGDFHNRYHSRPPAVACCDDRLVWVYSRLNTDTIFEAYALITDWDMGVGVVERPVFTQSPIQLSASLNRLSYDVPGQASLTLYSADGRKVLTETIEGKGIWEAPKLPSGVYFARVKDNSASARAKLVILH